MSNLKASRGPDYAYYGSGAGVLATPLRGDGAPGSPLIQHENVMTLRVLLDIPTTGAAAYTDFTSTHPGQAVTFSSHPGLLLAKWRKSLPDRSNLSNLLIHRGVLLVGTGFASGTPFNTLAGVTDVNVYVASDDYSGVSTERLYAPVTLAHPSAGFHAFDLPAFGDKPLVLNGNAGGTDFCRIVLSLYNANGITAGKAQLLLMVSEF